MFKKRISADTEKEEGEKKQPEKDLILWRGERVYVLYPMFVTFPTCQAERSPLKALAPLNTAPRHHDIKKEKSNDKNGLEKRRGENIVQKKN